MLDGFSLALAVELVLSLATQGLYGNERASNESTEKVSPLLPAGQERLDHPASGCRLAQPQQDVCLNLVTRRVRAAERIYPPPPRTRWAAIYVCPHPFQNAQSSPCSLPLGLASQRQSCCLWICAHPSAVAPPPTHAPPDGYRVLSFQQPKGQKTKMQSWLRATPLHNVEKRHSSSTSPPS